MSSVGTAPSASASPSSQPTMADQLNRGEMPRGANQWTPFCHVPSYMRFRTVFFDLIFSRSASSATVRYSLPALIGAGTRRTGSSARRNSRQCT